MEVFITAGKQLFIVLLILVSLPLACKLFPCMSGRPQNPLPEPLCRMYPVCGPGMGTPHLPQETGTAVLGNADII